MKIIALDQATKITGYSVWVNGKLKRHGILKSDVDENNPILRMELMYKRVRELIKREKPDFVALEGVFYSGRISTYNQLANMQGVIFGILFEFDIGFVVIEPTAWKAYCGIEGRAREAQKRSAIQRVHDIYKVDAEEDACEAICIGEWAVNNCVKKGESI